MNKKKESKYVMIRVLREDYKLARQMCPSFDVHSMRGLFHQLVLEYWAVQTFIPPLNEKLQTHLLEISKPNELKIPLAGLKIAKKVNEIVE